MDIGMIGLGRMGANMAERLRRGGHRVIGFDPLAKLYQQANVEAIVHADETEAVWHLYAPLLRRKAPPDPYPAGSWGPAAADRLLAAAGATWSND